MSNPGAVPASALSDAAPSLIGLFLEFLRVGATAFGGPAMVAYIRQMAVDRNGWVSPRTFKNRVALCQAVPGATAMQTAAYVGLSVRGAPGATASLVGFGLPAFGLMLAFSVVYAQARNLPIVVSAFSGLQVIVVAIVANAAVAFLSWDWPWLLLAGAAFAALRLGTNILWVVVLGTGLSLVLCR